jgi:hypothetical protein
MIPPALHTSLSTTPAVVWYVVQDTSLKGPVWRQVDELCDRNPLVAPLRLQRLREQQQLDTQLMVANTQLKERNVQLMDRNEQLSREVDQLRIRVAELEQQQPV